MSVSVDSTFAFDPNVQDSGMAAPRPVRDDGDVVRPPDVHKTR